MNYFRMKLKLDQTSGKVLYDWKYPSFVLIPGINFKTFPPHLDPFFCICIKIWSLLPVFILIFYQNKMQPIVLNVTNYIQDENSWAKVWNILCRGWILMTKNVWLSFYDDLYSDGQMLSLVEPNPANWGKSCSFQPPTDCAQRGEEQENHIKDQALRDRRTTDPVLIINFNLELSGAAGDRRWSVGSSNWWYCFTLDCGLCLCLFKDQLVLPGH